LKYIHILTITLTAVSGITIYSIAYGASNSISYVKEVSEDTYVQETTPSISEASLAESEDLNTEGSEIMAEPSSEIDEEIDTEADVEVTATTKQSEPKSQSVHTVPFYSQFTDISAPGWRKIGCGIASLAMLIDFYKPDEITVDGLLEEGIAANAYVSDAGWSHAGLIGLAKSYGLSGEAVYMTDQSMNVAFSKLETALEEGPVMVSVHYTFKPTNPIPHLVIVTGVEDGKVYYNDPAEKSGNGSISIEQFQSAWKKRYIAIRE